MLSDSGLFPHDRQGSEVETGYRLAQLEAVRRVLDRDELWVLWDVPLLVQEAWMDMGDPGPGWLHDVSASVPAKILSVGGFAHLPVLQRGVSWLGIILL